MRHTSGSARMAAPPHHYCSSLREAGSWSTSRDTIWTVAIGKRSYAANGFKVLPWLSVVDRAFAWLGRCRRLAKDSEQLLAFGEASASVAHIRLTARRLA
jgi:transposase